MRYGSRKIFIKYTSNILHLILGGQRKLPGMAKDERVSQLSLWPSVRTFQNKQK